MERLKFAAIDIGSNAVRLLICSISPENETESFTKELMIRVPIRLGQETFVAGKIDDDKRKKLVRLMKAFRHLLKVYDVTDYRVCATAAMREAKNAKEVVKDIKSETDFKIEIIDGHEEAIIIYESHFAYNLNDQQNYVFVDVGGGSTEISLISNGELVQSNSYKIGTVRLLFDKVDATEYDKLYQDLLDLKEQYAVSDMIASGGNIIKLNTLAQIRKGRKLSVAALDTLNEKLKGYTTDELIEVYNLKPDRADVITHAANIYLDVAKSIGAKSFIVPKIGLIDGIIHLLYVKWKSKKKNQKHVVVLENETAFETTIEVEQEK